MQDYEKLASFYLGRACEGASGAEVDRISRPPLLYDATDLTTHAVIIGMTGSGKTGLGVNLIEEAALDSVPVIAVDPKGDLGNLMLTFPNLAGTDFEPWVDPQQAAAHGQSPAEYAADQAAAWQQGLADWDQDGARIARLKAAAEFAIYTPGSSAGVPISVLGSFAAPATVVRDDPEALADRIEATTTSLLTLLGIDADPLTSREHILIATIFQHSWRAGVSLDLAGLIGAIQAPPVIRIGVMDLEAIYPAGDRFKLAMQLNNVLASPGFAAWMQGVPLAAGDLFHTATGKPRVSILSIAHLNDNERMFFVTLLLNEIIAWMRAQPGTASLRAILYMDELFGYMPPTASPPSKKLLLTLLKQARAFGLGLVLSTQNPMDLDYKGLSNTGTWFIGRLQTERDKDRVLDGLAGVGAQDGAVFDRQAMSRTLSALAKRVFLLHNVHETRPVTFATRWSMSYLAGPLTRDQIRRLTVGSSAGAAQDPTAASNAVSLPGSTLSSSPAAALPAADSRPALAAAIAEYFAPVRAPGGTAPVTYFPQVVGAADVIYISKTWDVDTRRQFLMVVEAGDGPVALDWNSAEDCGLAVNDLGQSPSADAAFAELAAAAREPGNYRRWAGDFSRWLRQDKPLTLYRSAAFKLVSTPQESETDFRIRLNQKAREARDLQMGALRARFDKQTATLQERLARARQKIATEQTQATQQKMQSALSIGSALFGAFMGRKTLSAASINRIGTAARRTGRAAKEARDVDIAEADAGELQDEITALASQFDAEVAALAAPAGGQEAALEEVSVRAKSSDINVLFVALLWWPHRQGSDGRWRPA